MKALDRKLRRDLRSSAGLILAITSIITVGVACFVAMRSSYSNLRLAQARYYQQCRMADFTIELKKAPLAEIDRMMEISGVTEIRARIQFFTTVDLERSRKPVNAVVLSLPDEPSAVINSIVLRQGGYFTSARANEVIVNESFARRNGVFPGQWIHLLLNDRRQELFVVGTAVSSEYAYLVAPGAIMPDPEHFGVFYLKRSYAEEIYDFEGAANQVLGLVSPSLREHPEEVLRRAELLLEPYGVSYTTPRSQQPSHRFITNEIQGLGTFATIMPSIFLLVAALVLNMLMSRITEHQRVIVGTLKALGYSDLQIFAHFLKFALVIGSLGGFLGAALGYVLAEGMTLVYRSFFEFPNLTNGFYPAIYATGVAISLVCAWLGSFHGARNVLKLHPAEAMRSKPPARGGPILLERVRWFWGRLGFAWRMSLRNMIRAKLRTAAGVFAAAMGASIMVNGFMMQRAVQHMIDFQFSQLQRSDIDLTVKDELSDDVVREAIRLPGVDHAEPTFDVGGEWRHGPYHRKGSLTGLVPNARLTVLRDAASRPVRIPAFGCAMTRKMAELLHVEQGDVVTLVPNRGRQEPKQVPVVEIIDSFVGLAVYGDIHYVSRLVDEELGVTGVQLAIQPAASVQDELYRELKRFPALRSLSARSDIVHNLFETLVRNQRFIISMLIGFAGVIFFGSVLNSSLISLAEREREVGTLRVLGYTPWQIGGMFLRESLLVNAAGIVLGLPLGYGLSYLITVVYNTEMFRIPLVTPIDMWLRTVLLGSIFGLVAHAFVQRAIHRLDWLESMKTRE